jgi:hypothetical protein
MVIRMYTVIKLLTNKLDELHQKSIKCAKRLIFSMLWRLSLRKNS